MKLIINDVRNIDLYRGTISPHILYDNLHSNVHSIVQNYFDSKVGHLIISQIKWRIL